MCCEKPRSGIYQYGDQILCYDCGLNVQRVLNVHHVYELTFEQVKAHYNCYLGRDPTNGEVQKWLDWGKRLGLNESEPTSEATGTKPYPAKATAASQADRGAAFSQRRPL